MQDKSQSVPVLIDRRGLLAILAGTVASGMVPGISRMAMAQTTGALRIGVFTEPPSLDPHWQATSSSASLSQHVFDRLFHTDENQQIVPGLATSWKAVDPLTWEIQLREGVTFHDGSPFTADDVVFTFERSQNVPNAPFSFKTYLGDKTVEKVSDHLIRITTERPNPILPNEVTVPIISHIAGATATTDNYNSGAAMIGTGPFRFGEWRQGEVIRLERNDGYWGGASPWSEVQIRPISSNPARVAALVAGDVDLIDFVPPSSREMLQGNAGIDLFSGVTNRVIYLSFDHARETTPFVTAKDGSSIPNPLRNPKVRQAISKAINRQALTDRVLEGMGEPAGQLVPPQIFGADPNLGPDTFDAEAARALLTEAGYPDGFAMTLHGSNDRYVNDAQVTEAIAQMLSRIGIATKVETMPYSVFAPRATRGGPEGLSEFSMFLFGYGGGTGEASIALRSVVATHNSEKGLGGSNRGRYSNPQVDEVFGRAVVELDDAKRAELLAEATRLAMADVAVAPIYFPVNYWATRSGLTYVPRTDERTMAMSTGS